MQFRPMFLAMLSIALLATVACETNEQRDSMTATAKAFVAEDNAAIETSTAEASPAASPTPAGGQTLQSFSRAVQGGTGTPAPADAPTPIAIPVPSPTSTSVGTTGSVSATAPVPTSTPVPTATAVPAATPKPELGPWLTAFEAIEVASAFQTGIVKEITGHVSRRSGETDSGDTSNSVASPGAGYSSGWGVTILDGEQLHHCVARGASVNCSELFSVGAGDIEAATTDSTAVFGTWEDDADWSALMAQDDISILLQLKPNDTGDSLIWNAFVTVHNATEAPYGGNFLWNPGSGVVESNTY